MGKQKHSNKDWAWFFFLLAVGSATMPGPVKTEIEPGALSARSASTYQTKETKGQETGSRSLGIEKPSKIAPTPNPESEPVIKTFPLSQNRQGKIIYPNQPQPKETSKPIETQSVKVVKMQSEWVISGDSIGQSGTISRLAGVDAPQVGECYGTEARMALASNLEEISVINQATWVRARGKNINYELVSKGYAKADSFGLDAANTQKFKEAQAKAKRHKLGIWHDC